MHVSKLIKSYRYASKVQCKLREEPEEGLFKAAEKVAYLWHIFIPKMA